MSRILNDEPIQSHDEDRLGRRHLAEAMGAEVKSLDASHGAVIAVLGPWGSGKTSLLNMIVGLLSGPPWVTIVRFNPWLFSGSGELVTRFFYELSAQLKADRRNPNEVADMLSDYGEVMAPLQTIPAVGWIFGMARSVGEIQKRRKGGVHYKKEAIERELARIDGRVVVFVDDIDRLDTAEIRDIFKLVRLTGNLPNVVYVLAFDRSRVEQALEAEATVPGRAYLEKIVQSTHDLPAIPGRLLRTEVTHALGAVLEDVSSQYLLDPTRWPDIFQEIVYPLIRNLRDIHRFTASVPATVESLDGKLELSDLVALEAVRVFLPDLFRLLTDDETRIALTSPLSNYHSPDEVREQRLAQRVKDFVGQSPNNAVAASLVNRLFPDASRHLLEGFGSPQDRLEYWKQRRVAHPILLDFYLEHTEGAEQSALYLAERSLEHVESSESFQTYFRNLDNDERTDVLVAMDYVVNDVPENARLDVAVGLLSLFGEDTVRPVGMFELSIDKQLTRLVSTLIRQIESEESRNSFAEQLFERVPSLSTRFALLQWIGYSEAEEENPVGEETSKDLARQLRLELASTTPTELHAEPYLFGMMKWAGEVTTDAFPPAIPPDSVAACNLLRQARADSKSRLFTSRHVEVVTRLDWMALVEIVGSEEWIRSAIEFWREQGPDSEDLRTIELAERYLAGWRPGFRGD